MISNRKKLTKFDDDARKTVFRICIGLREHFHRSNIAIAAPQLNKFALSKPILNKTLQAEETSMTW